MKQNLKQDLISYLAKLLEKKISSLDGSIASLKESRNNETKSTAGDKHETSREMVQFELEKYSKQLQILLKQKQDLLQIDVCVHYEKIQFGSLVKTNQGNYFLSIPVGKIELKGETYFAISAVSPIGKLMLGKMKGDNFSFNQDSSQILKIW